VASPQPQIYFSNSTVLQEPYYPYLCTQFSNAYDVYLDICRQVDQQINENLGYTTPVERLRHSCPPCFYQLHDEPELEFSCLVSIDGNNSLKRLGTSVRGVNDRLDTRSITSDRWVSMEEVDRFKDEVQSRVSIDRVKIGCTDANPICYGVCRAKR